MKTTDSGNIARLEALRTSLDGQTARYEQLRGVNDVRSYLLAKGASADEEILTEPILAMLIERLLGFPTDGYFPQLGKGGQKPDFTPIDLIAHPFVLDAKSSAEALDTHEPQIRRYMRQRGLDYGVLFNLREVAVYQRGAEGRVPELSFKLVPVWEVARGEALATEDLAAFHEFCDLFRYRELTLEDKIDYVKTQPLWAIRLATEELEVDVEALVERLRRLAGLLAADAAAQEDSLGANLKLQPGRERRLVDELRLLALDVAPGVDPEELPDTIAGWRAGQGLAARAWRQYMLRVAYLALTRILLYRAWEDVEFAPSYLYDGGFGDAYERLSQNARNVLREALQEGAERYRWLYGPDNNYDWYRPREPALVEVLYSLAPIPLGKLDADVLGGLYVSYVDEIDRDRLGQFFTPRPVVRFMLDRAGFDGPNGVFHVEGDQRRPVRMLDFATGSGGFVVEAARRIIDRGGIDVHDPRDLLDALLAVSRGIVGGEISPFPYYLTEVNLLLQVSRLLGFLATAHAEQPRFVLGVLHTDTLSAKGTEKASIEGMDPSLRADHGELVRDEAFGLVPLDGEKLETYRELKRDGTFDLVVGNPPYVAEANNKPLFDRLRAIPAWKGIYRGKTDYLYYFLWLAVEKLAPGGRLAVITPAGWMNAGAADFLRAKLSSELRLDELFLFGSYRLFADEQGPAPTPTVESAILVATKAPAPDGHALRVVALEDEAAAGHPARDALLEEMTKRAAGKPGRAKGIHVHDLPQAALTPLRPWPVKHAEEDIASSLVSHLERLLADEGSAVECLGRPWNVFMGIETGADAYTRRIQKRLPVEVRRALELGGAAIGDPILQLPPGRENLAPWAQHQSLLAKAPEARAILYGVIDEADYVTYVRLDRGADIPNAVLAELEPWRPILATRAEIARNPTRKWWETVWPRDATALGQPKVIGVHRTNRGRFAVDEDGTWKPGKNAVVVTARTSGDVAYLCGLLNSELVDLWYAIRGRVPRDVWRDYEPRPMKEIPYRRPEDDPRAEQVADLVRQIADNRRALLPHRAVVRDLGRIVKDPWKSGPAEIDRAALVAELPAEETVSVHLDPALKARVSGKLGKPKRESATVISFRNGRVEGDADRLDLLEVILEGRAPDDLPGVLLPKDADGFDARVAGRAATVTSLLEEGSALVEEVERLVCALYEVPDDLTEEIVEHAVRRAGSSRVDSDE